MKNIIIANLRESLVEQLNKKEGIIKVLKNPSRIEPIILSGRECVPLISLDGFKEELKQIQKGLSELHRNSLIKMYFIANNPYEKRHLVGVEIDSTIKASVKDLIKILRFRLNQNLESETNDVNLSILFNMLGGDMTKKNIPNSTEVTKEFLKEMIKN